MNSIMAFQPSSVIFFNGLLLLGAYTAYRWLLPKPIPGIPHNRKATKSVLGDIPGLMEHLKHSKTITDWFLGNNLKHDSPIVQIFLNLFQRPVVIINDFKEQQDILVRRSKEFAKPDSISDMFYGIVREHHTRLHSDDERFKLQRKWLQDLMSQKFLHGVAGPHLHKTFMELVGLWKEKLRLSGPESQAFSAKNDITHSALEAIWAAMFGTGETATITMKQTGLLSSLTPGSIKRHNNGALDFPAADRATTFDAILRLTETFEVVCKSPFPLIHGWFLPYRFSNLVKTKNSLIIHEITKAKQRMHDVNGEQGRIFNAVDHMLHREAQQANKDARSPEYYSKAMIAEIFGFLIAGHETTSQTIMWILKILSDHPAVQSRLRNELRTTYSDAMADGRIPTAKEIASLPIQYLDACIEEFMRCSKAGPMTSRTSTTDAVVLGHVIPKGTRIFMMSSGAGVLTPAHEIPDSVRSPTYQSAGGGKIGSWDESMPEEMAAFNPDRWLRTEMNGSKVFDSTLGPQMGFGAGPRGCFGRKLAYLEVRLVIVLLLWHFELQKVPEHLGGYEAIEVLTHGPIHCYVRLSAAL